MATEIAKAYVQIIPSAKGISGAISKEMGGEAASAGKSAGSSFGSNLVGTVGKVVAAAGVGKMLKDAVNEAGNLQQSFGGLETIYGDAAAAAKDYAAQAAEAGISSNEFAEQAVSFGAALRQAYGGDTSKAIDAANKAILDMTDNAAKMGTPIESIQMAYQGFARGQYQLLDNLKIGYGGTRSEMLRLLADAEKISGVEYNIDNLGDVYDAIHVIQGELGLTGVAAEEAKSTLSGSFQAMTAAAKNLMGNLALGEDITQELDVLTKTFFNWARNLLPLVGNVLKGLPQLIKNLLSGAIGALNIGAQNAPGIVQAGIDIVTGIAQAIIGALPYLAESAINIVLALGQALLTTDWGEVGRNLISGIKDSMSVAAGEIFGSDQSIITAVGQSITNGLPQLLQNGVQLISNLANGILQGLPTVITNIGNVMTQLLNFILQQAPTILENGAQLIVNFAQGFIKSLPSIASAVGQIIVKFTATIAQNLPRILQSGIQIIAKLAAGIIQAIPELAGKIPTVIQAIVSEFAKYNWGDIGINIIKGIANGILSGVGIIVDAAVNAAKAAFDAAKGALGIESPSKLGFWLGKMFDVGIAKGIIGNVIGVRQAARDVAQEMGIASGTVATSAMLSTSSARSGSGSTERLLSLLERYLPMIAKGMHIDGQSLVTALDTALGMETF